MAVPAPDVPSAPSPTSYVLRTGDRALDRLRILDQLTWPTTSALLHRVGVGPGTSTLDAGCGSGLVTMRMARLTRAATIGIDTDAVAIDHARAAAAAGGLAIHFEHTALETYAPPPGGPHNSAPLTAPPSRRPAPSAPPLVDVAYARFLLSHVQQPKVALRHLIGTARPGGWVVAEDVHFPGHFCAPANAAFDRYIELYEAASRVRGANARLGIELPALFRSAGLEDVGFAAHVPTFSGPDQLDGLRFAALTLEGISDALVEAGLTTRPEVDGLIRELEAFARRDGTVMSMVRICQTWGRVPDAGGAAPGPGSTVRTPAG